jgi:hypothetical protein
MVRTVQKDREVQRMQSATLRNSEILAKSRNNYKKMETMREIKFRGKRLDNDIQTGPADGWVTGFYYQGLCEGEVRHFIASCPCVWEVDPATVGQYTGLKDKNTRKVYEGDVLTDKFESVGVVKWQNGCFVVNFGDVDVFQISDCFDDSYQMWVIGNIHDNPEMLKGGE